MKETLAKICELQPKYSSSNTPAMQERGLLIRTELAGELRNRLPVLQGAFDSLFEIGHADVHVQTLHPGCLLYLRYFYYRRNIDSTSGTAPVRVGMAVAKYCASP